MLVATLLFISSVNSTANELVKRTQVMMGTYVSISAPKGEQIKVQQAFERLHQVDMALSSYDPKAEIYRLNQDGKVVISSDTYEALQLSQGYYQRSDGYFDVTIGAITRGLFHFGEEERVPSQDERFGVRLGLDGLKFSKTSAQLEKGIRIDLGGMGKGFGVDKARMVLEGVHEGIIALSGDIFCFHRCEMAIQDPFSEGKLARFSMAYPNTGISTSGTYRRYVGSTDNNHLINPKTRQSQKNFVSITLISKSMRNADLDAYATAASVMHRAKAFRFLRSFEGLGYFVMDAKGRVYQNSVFEKLVRRLVISKPAIGLERGYIRVSPSEIQSSKRQSLWHRQRASSPE